ARAKGCRDVPDAPTPIPTADVDQSSLRVTRSSSPPRSPARIPLNHAPLRRVRRCPGSALVRRNSCRRAHTSTEIALAAMINPGQALACPRPGAGRARAPARTARAEGEGLGTSLETLEALPNFLSREEKFGSAPGP